MLLTEEKVIVTWNKIYQNLHAWKKKESHKCEVGGAPLRISFYHLLINLKNK